MRSKFYVARFSEVLKTYPPSQTLEANKQERICLAIYEVRRRGLRMGLFPAPPANQDRKAKD